MIKGQIVGGSLNNISIRGKNKEKLELGELLVAERPNNKDQKDFTIFQIKDIEYKSQAKQSTHELLSGLEIEGYGSDLEFFEPELKNYLIANAKALIDVKGQGKNQKPVIKSPKQLPPFFNDINPINENHLDFLKPDPNMDSLFLGNVRSGSDKLDVEVIIDAIDSLTHHILIPATTGRGKSNLVKVILWGLMDSEKTGILVLDPHNEYYGDNIKKGLRNHPKKDQKLEYYTTTPGTGNSLIINVSKIHYNDFNGIMTFTTPQSDAMYMLHQEFRENWIKEIIKGVDPKIRGDLRIGRETLNVLQRRFKRFFGMDHDGKEFEYSKQLFTAEKKGENTLKDIIKSLESSKIVIIDSSRLSDTEELFIGSMISRKVFSKYKRYDSVKLKKKPVISIVIEEAPRVLSSEVLGGYGGGNIYATIAKEGRKFKIGLIAITQLVSVIPKTILANMNTKIILGNEMATERSYLIDSAAQDLSEDNRIIASLDKGEAIVSSVFTKFAVPIKIPLFDDYVDRYIEKLDLDEHDEETEYAG